jgi:8-oxo-dGTP diphosphatase
MEQRNRILKELTHTPKRSFNQLWANEGPSNTFAYHLQALEKDGLVEKAADGQYQLTLTGKRTVAYNDGSTGHKEPAPIIGVLVVVFDGDNVLLSERTREPFYGYWGMIGGKVKFSQYILEAAAAELKEETGLEADLELKGLFSSKTESDGALAYNHQMFIIKATNPTGALLKETREGRPQWVAIAEVTKHNIFPNVPLSLEIAQSERFLWIEVDRYQENDQFTRMDIRHKKTL